MLVQELARASQRIRSLERERDFLQVHARNLELELRYLRREMRHAPGTLPRTEPDGAFWRARYEEVVASWSWRVIWWLGTPYRAWIRVRRPGR